MTSTQTRRAPRQSGPSGYWGQVLFGSFDAERAWRPAELAALPSVADTEMDRSLAGMDELLAGLGGPGDVLLTGRPLDAALDEVLRAAGVRGDVRTVPGDAAAAVETRIAIAGRGHWHGIARPYAVTSASAAAADAAGLSLPATDAATAARVNSKSFSDALVHDLGLAGGGQMVSSVAGLRRAVAAVGGPVVLKDPFGVAGRSIVEITSPGVLATVVRLLERDLRRGLRIELLVQPRYERLADVSAHFEVNDSGVQPLGLRTIDADGFGYGGSGPVPPALAGRLERLDYLPTVLRVAERVAAEGYRGPLCIDSMVTREVGLVPLLEINARTSMGLVALAWQSRGGGRDVFLRQMTVAVRPHAAGAVDSPFARLATLLDETGLLATTDRPGIRPLSAATLTPPRGRLIYALVGVDPAGAQPNVAAALERAGLDPLDAERRLTTAPTTTTQSEPATPRRRGGTGAV